jgi:hypothetical protein
MRSPFLLAFTALAVAAAPLAAQAGNACAAKGPKLPAAGGWAEYQTDRGTLRMSYIAHETAGERLEMSVTGERGSMVMQMVVPGFPYEMTDVKEVVMQQAGQPPMRMNEQMLGMMRGRMPNGSQVSNETCARMTEVGKERITVPAGTFETTHYRDSTGSNDVWVSASIPFGMVKASHQNASTHQTETVVLAGSGRGATSKITGTPQEMPGMMGPPPGGRPRSN